MSGFEVAGVILATVPLVIASIVGYKESLARTEMKFLERRFKTEHLIFLNSIEELLSPVVPDARLAELMEDPGGRGWQDTNVSSKLEEHMGGTYPLFLEIINDIKTMVLDLKGKLIPDQEDVKRRRVFKRIKLFITKSRSEAGLSRMSMRISELGTLMGQIQRLAPSRRARGFGMEPYEEIRECALSLYDALSRGWHCECETPHLANLRLEARKPLQKARRPSGEGHVRFKFLFSFTADENKGEQPRDWREAELALLDPPHLPHLTDNQEEAARTRSQVIEGLGESQVATDVPLQRLDTSTSGPHRSRSLRFHLSSAQVSPSSHNQEEDQHVGESDPLEIKDLCEWIKNVHTTDTSDEKCLGYLCNTQGVRYGLFSVNRRRDVRPPLASFHVGEPLSPSRSRRRSRREGISGGQVYSEGLRRQFAFTLGSTILQLHSTPWLEKWAKQDILYLSGPEMGAFQAPIQPFLSSRFTSSKSPKRVTSTITSSTEPQKFARNETLFTLGIVLIEIAYNESIEALAISGDFALLPSMTQYFTAIRLQKEMLGVMGERYQRAIAGCLFCDFGLKRPNADLNDTEFQRRFLEHVVVPLEESCNPFHL